MTGILEEGNVVIDLDDCMRVVQNSGVGGGIDKLGRNRLVLAVP